MKVITQPLTIEELKKLAANTFVEMIKGVVDIERKILAVDAELHSDLEAYLLENGSKQKDLWGINLYPDKSEKDWIEFDSMINVRPSQGNRSRGVESLDIQIKVKDTVNDLIL